ncbi:MAG: hypothetical protein RDU89_11715 [bacterium]|nr:hypothetical protein [bacterium]
MPEPAEPYHYPPYRYWVEGPSLHLVAAGFSLAGHPSAKADYWVVMGDPVTVKIHFAQAVASSRDVLRQVLEDINNGLAVREVGIGTDFIFVKLSLHPGRYVLGPVATERAEDHRMLILDRCRPYRLMRWQAGAPPSVVGEYSLPARPISVGPGSPQEEALFATQAFAEAGDAVRACLWRWQPDVQPSFAPLPGLHATRSMYGNWVFPRWEDLVIQSHDAVLVVEHSGDQVAQLVEGPSYAVAVGPGGEIAVFLDEEDGRGELGPDLVLFTADLKRYRTWKAICPREWFRENMRPIWYGDEIFFLAPDDGRQYTPRQLMAVDVGTGTLRRVLGQLEGGCQLGRSHYLLLRQGEWVLWDVATLSLRPLPSAGELGERSWAQPVAAGSEWVVFDSSSGLIAWHPTIGATPLGSGFAFCRAGEAFLWWTEVR